MKTPNNIFTLFSFYSFYVQLFLLQDTHKKKLYNLYEFKLRFNAPHTLHNIKNACNVAFKTFRMEMSDSRPKRSHAYRE